MSDDSENSRVTPDAATTEEAAEQARQILRALRRVLRAVTLQSKRLARDSGLTLPQVAALRALATDEDGLTVVGLSRALETSAPTMTGIVDRLERSGLVTKERSKSDRRKIVVRLTDDGSTKIANLPEQAHEKFVAGVLALDPFSRTILHQSLDRVIELMEEQDYDAAPFLAAEESLDEPPHGE